MNEINFLNSYAEKNYISFNRWKIISILLLCPILAFMIFSYIKTLITIKNLNIQKNKVEQQLADFDGTMIKKRETVKKKDTVTKYLKNIQQKSSINNKIFAFDILSTITQNIPDDLYLQSFEYNLKNGIIIKGFSYIINSILLLIQNLEKLPFTENVKLEFIKFKESQQDETNDEISFLHEFFITLKLKNK